MHNIYSIHTTKKYRVKKITTSEIAQLQFRNNSKKSQQNTVHD